MNFLRALQRHSKYIPLIPRTMCEGYYSIIGNFQSNTFSSVNVGLPTIGFLKPQLPTIVPSCGMKIKGRMRLRCKDCYYIRREGRLYVMCKSFPRHKQTHMVKREKYTWILTHACQSKFRPY